MRRPALYSSSRPARTGPDAPEGSAAPEGTQASEAPSAVATAAPARQRFRFSNVVMLWSAIVVLAGMLAFTVHHSLQPGQRRLTQDEFNAAVMKTLETQVMPSEYARAYENVRPAVVRVISYVKKSRLKDAKEHGNHAHSGTKPKPLGSASVEPPGDNDEE